jgi:hypothetical protein
MEEEEQHRGFFEAAIKNSDDITETYLNRSVIVRKILGDTPSVASDFARIVRKELEKPENGRLGLFSDIPIGVLSEVVQWQKDGLIGAVDGTAAIDQTILPDKIVFGVAVATATSKLQSPPTVTYTQTYRDEKPPTNIQSILDLQQMLEDASESKSWTRTFRELKEREAAIGLVNDGLRLVLIDGPLYTQNLLTQSGGQSRVLEKIQANQTRYIGYIKEQSPFHKHLGAALNPGEYWVFDSFKDLLAQRRFGKDDAQSTHPAAEWIKKAGHWVRCVYKLKSKAFEFECDASMVMHGLALLKVDPSHSLNHEIPFLLELVDRHVRAKTDAAHISRDLIMSLGQHAIAFENEREFRA